MSNVGRSERKRGRAAGLTRRLSALAVAVAVASTLALLHGGATWGATGYDPASDMNSMFNTTAYSGAAAFWNAGFTGKGVVWQCRPGV
jgi:hypothetical protein